MLFKLFSKMFTTLKFEFEWDESNLFEFPKNEFWFGTEDNFPFIYIQKCSIISNKMCFLFENSNEKKNHKNLELKYYLQFRKYV